MRKITAFIIVIIFIFLLAGCGQATFAEIEKRGWFYEENYKVTNLSGDTLYIESYAESGKSGDKQISISLISGQGKEHIPQYHDFEGISDLPAEVGPNGTGRGYVVFTDLPSDWSVVTLTVKQTTAGDKEGEVIFTEEITKESLSS